MPFLLYLSPLWDLCSGVSFPFCSSDGIHRNEMRNEEKVYLHCWLLKSLFTSVLESNTLVKKFTN